MLSQTPEQSANVGGQPLDHGFSVWINPVGGAPASLNIPGTATSYALSVPWLLFALLINQSLFGWFNPIILLLVGFKLALGMLIVINGRDRAEVREDDRMLLADLNDPDAKLVVLTVQVDGAVTGEDVGVIWFENGRLLFNGNRTSFSIRRDDLVLPIDDRFQFEEAFSDLRTAKDSIRLRVRRHLVRIALRDLDGKHLSVVGTKVRWTDRYLIAEVGPKVSASGSGDRNLSQFPPLEPDRFFQDRQLAPLVVKTVAVWTLWASVFCAVAREYSRQHYIGAPTAVAIALLFACAVVVTGQAINHGQEAVRRWKMNRRERSRLT
jgi:hypothetical protein